VSLAFAHTGEKESTEFAPAPTPEDRTGGQSEATSTDRSLAPSATRDNSDLTGAGNMLARRWVTEGVEEGIGAKTASQSRETSPMSQGLQKPETQASADRKTGERGSGKRQTQKRSQRIAPEGLAALAELRAEMSRVLSLPADENGVPREWNLSPDQYPLEWRPIIDRAYTDATQAMNHIRIMGSGILHKTEDRQIKDCLSCCDVELDLLRNLPPVLSGQQPASIRTLCGWMRTCETQAVVTWMATQPEHAAEGWRLNKLSKMTTGISLAPQTNRRALLSKTDDAIYPWRAHLGALAIALTPTLSMEVIHELLDPTTEDPRAVQDESTVSQAALAEVRSLTQVFEKHGHRAPQERLHASNTGGEGGANSETRGQRRAGDQAGSPQKKSSKMLMRDVLIALRLRAHGSALYDESVDKAVFSTEYWSGRKQEAIHRCFPSELRPSSLKSDAADVVVRLTTQQIECMMRARQERVLEPNRDWVNDEASEARNDLCDLTYTLRNMPLAPEDPQNQARARQAWRALCDTLADRRVQGRWLMHDLSLATLCQTDAAKDHGLEHRLLHHASRVSQQTPDDSRLLLEAGMALVEKTPAGISGQVRRVLRNVLLRATEYSDLFLSMQSLSTLSTRLTPRDELRPLVGALVLRNLSAGTHAASWEEFLAHHPRPNAQEPSPVVRLVNRVVKDHATAQRREAGIGVVADLWVRQLAKADRPVCEPREPVWKKCCESDAFWSVLIACDVSVTRDAPESFWRLALQRQSRPERQVWIRRLAQRRTMTPQSGKDAIAQSPRNQRG